MISARERMLTKQSGCCYHKIFDRQRKDAPLTFDFSLSVGFRSGFRWINPKHPDQIIEFSLKQAEVQLNLENGAVALEEGQYRTELDSDNFAAQGNFNNSKNPFWTIKPKTSYLCGNLTRVELCTVTTDEKCNFSYSSKINVQPMDIVITRRPSSWINSLPFQGLLNQKIKLKIMEVISSSKNSIESESTLTE